MPIKLKGSSSGDITLDVPATAGTNTLTLPAVTDTLTGIAATQTLTNKTLTSPTITSPTISGTPVMGASVITSGTAQASTSGTSIDFTSIPSWVKRITVMFNGVSTNGSSFVQTQVGAGSIATSGYLGSSQNMYTANTFQINALGTGFLISAASAANAIYGTLVLNLFGSNTWVGVGAVATGVTGGSNYQQGIISLGGTLDRVRITTVNGTDTFDAGSINILYE